MRRPLFYVLFRLLFMSCFFVGDVVFMKETEMT